MPINGRLLIGQFLRKTDGWAPVYIRESGHSPQPHLLAQITVRLKDEKAIIVSHVIRN